ncbi:hypothetical protein ACMU_02195 [Actibacterium mucosum KCTC 23349]|uniref:Magnesium transporter MgtE intracellular domain-containing protein n=1 Tax=Actibacterium mucosum KCTC 23349 TaxID=1454373 RepID=A0A037ZP56_9RHOB|nr:hypothetical protein [Actibacterium mucosum]KAJ57333.1 hypothetical protein ACMU_02195 [Actibacterium mucosum KCTC 23349]
MTKRAKLTKRGSRGALVAVAVLLALSGGMRLGNGTGQALAREVEALGDLVGQPKVQTVHRTGACTLEDGVAPLLERLQSRELILDAREADLNERARTLDLIAADVEKRIAVLEQAEMKLRATISVAEEAAEKDIAKLTSVYENMKPKEAARLFEEMAPGFAAGFLGRMRPDAAAAVLAGMSPGAAYQISAILAGRNADVPTE